MLDLKVGDKVVVVRRPVGRGVEFSRPCIIVRVTKTQATIEGGRRFLLRNGVEVGDYGWCPAYIEPATPELMAEIADQRSRQDAMAKCKRASEYLSCVDKDDAVRVAAMIPEEWMK